MTAHFIVSAETALSAFVFAVLAVELAVLAVEYAVSILVRSYVLTVIVASLALLN